MEFSNLFPPYGTVGSNCFCSLVSKLINIKCKHKNAMKKFTIYYHLYYNKRSIKRICNKITGGIEKYAAVAMGFATSHYSNRFIYVISS